MGTVRTVGGVRGISRPLHLCVLVDASCSHLTPWCKLLHEEALEIVLEITAWSTKCLHDVLLYIESELQFMTIMWVLDSVPRGENIYLTVFWMGEFWSLVEPVQHVQRSHFSTADYLVRVSVSNCYCFRIRPQLAVYLFSVQFVHFLA